jgi:hypothetical protein
MHGVFQVGDQLVLRNILDVLLIYNGEFVNNENSKNKDIPWFSLSVESSLSESATSCFLTLAGEGSTLG